MGKILLFLCTFILLYTLPNIIAECGEGQIDINTASLEDLDKLSGIGPAYANAIINSRPFSSIDSLIDVKGIGPVSLEKIKTQGLACVKGEQENTSEESIQEKEEEVPPEEQTLQEEESTQEEETAKEDTSINNRESQKVITSIKDTTKEEIKTITLSPQSIKSEINKEELSKNKFSLYGLVTFCILLIFLFVLKKRKNEKTEFK
jgi:competence ComEA-like helix-hairpin-helix protein